MSALSINDQITMVEVLLILAGIAITWAVYYGSERAELPGDASIPEPGLPDDVEVDARGRTL
ncbi:MAG TPA: hypothetical protein VJQ43_04575 [Thermoplasmata archaeon]|nr:hypothetical protein [Thermoplasmata archaeon]